MSRDNAGGSTTTARRVDRNRRAVLLGVATALVGGLAGCSGGDGSGDGDDGADPGDGDTSGDGSGDGGDGAGETTDSDDGSSQEAGDERDGDDSPTRESTGEVATDAIPEIDILGWSSEANRDRFRVTVTVENAGSETIAPDSYTWGLRMYGEGGDQLDSAARVSAITLGDNDELPAGERGEVMIEARPDDATQVASYELHLSCEGQYADGAYCSE